MKTGCRSNVHRRRLEARQHLLGHHVDRVEPAHGTAAVGRPARGLEGQPERPAIADAHAGGARPLAHDREVGAEPAPERRARPHVPGLLADHERELQRAPHAAAPRATAMAAAAIIGYPTLVVGRAATEQLAVADLAAEGSAVQRRAMTRGHGVEVRVPAGESGPPRLRSARARSADLARCSRAWRGYPPPPGARPRRVPPPPRCPRGTRSARARCRAAAPRWRSPSIAPTAAFSATVNISSSLSFTPSSPRPPRAGPPTTGSAAAPPPPRRRRAPMPITARMAMVANAMPRVQHRGRLLERVAEAAVGLDELAHDGPDHGEGSRRP